MTADIDVVNQPYQPLRMARVMAHTEIVSAVWPIHHVMKFGRRPNIAFGPLNAPLQQQRLSPPLGGSKPLLTILNYQFAGLLQNNRVSH